jgi:pyrimidine operon attenuation protein/uracil phosphoribosyltransferase
MEDESDLQNAAAVESLLDRMAADLARPRYHRLAMVGIRTRGVPLAVRLADRLRGMIPDPVPVGALDITLYRDDLSQTAHWPVLRGTEISFPVDGATLVLVDDVLHTGRTIRAALNALCDLGRPAAIRLAVLVERNGRELPIQADCAGVRLELPAAEWVDVRIREIDGEDAVVRRRGTRPGRART